MIFEGYLLSLIYGIFCIVLSGIVYKCGIKSIYTRKITHILIGFEWAILYHYFGASIHFLIICLVFLVILLISSKTRIFPQLHSNDDNSHGTLYYGIAMSLMGIVTLIVPKMVLPFGIAVFCTSFGDGLAGIFGQIQKHNLVLSGKKTLYGSLACFVASFLAAHIICYFYEINIPVYQMLFIAILAAEVELISKNGLDNITLTLGVSLFSYCLIYHQSVVLERIVPLLLTIPVVVFVNRKKTLTKWGVTSALILDLIVAISFGNKGFLVLIIFFGGSLIFDKIKKRATKTQTEKRNAIQVFANSIVGAISALIYMFYPHKLFVILFSAVFAESFADTVASSAGALSKHAYDPFRRREVENGLSGGMTILGTIFSFIASLSISLLSMSFSSITWIDAAIIAISGFLGAVFDSFLGSLAQAKYICKKCNSLVETPIHCEEFSEKVSGVSGVDNNVVNILSTVFASIVAAMLFCLYN